MSVIHNLPEKYILSKQETLVLEEGMQNITCVFASPPRAMVTANTILD
ncbi:MAG: hypothetical protein GY823_02470 [Flavobacteriaceae bacterium]|nr:hypothetical protein [Flavobacteriaceae bacterium]